MTLLALAIFAFVGGMNAASSAARSGKFTAATMSSAIAWVGGPFLFLFGLLLFLLAWGIWKQKSWAVWSAVIIEALYLLLSLYLLISSPSWITIAQSLLAVTILICIFVDPKARATLR
jgi:uncharacterized membrane protein (DUF2068 family)